MVYESVRPNREGVTEVAMNLVLSFLAYVEQSEIEQRTNVGALGMECNEDRDISGIIFGVPTIREKVYGPLEPSHYESLTHDVFPNAHSFR